MTAVYRSEMSVVVNAGDPSAEIDHVSRISKKVKVVNLYSALRIHASSALLSLTRAAGRTATACSLQTQASAAAG